jgi:hypothetical protein
VLKKEESGESFAGREAGSGERVLLFLRAFGARVFRGFDPFPEGAGRVVFLLGDIGVPGGALEMNPFG